MERIHLKATAEPERGLRCGVPFYAIEEYEPELDQTGGVVCVIGYETDRPKGWFVVMANKPFKNLIPENLDLDLSLEKSVTLIEDLVNK